MTTTQTIDGGDGKTQWVFPILIEGTCVECAYGNDIEIREHKQKHIGWLVRNCDCPKDMSYRAMVGKKVRVTIEIVEDAK
jgi:hypothetical protein